MERHFTVSGFLVDGERTLLHWHLKSQLWLPPGGHIERDEDPLQAVVREVLEETGFTAEVVSATTPLPVGEPVQLPPPLTILVEDIPQGPHQHIDFIYALRPVAGRRRTLLDDDPFVWVTATELHRGDPLPVASCGVDVALPEDVRLLALQAIALVNAMPVASAAAPL